MSLFAREPEGHGLQTVDEWPSVQGFAPRVDPEKIGATGFNPLGSTDRQALRAGPMRRWNILLITIFLSCLAAGCGWFSGKPKAVASLSGSPQTPAPVTFVRDGKVVDAQSLKEGGKIVIIPFQAGDGVEATDQLDKAALMLVKGIADLLEKEGAPFKVLTDENAADADFIIKGHITKISKPSLARRWLFGNSRISLEVEGRMVEARSGRSILVFAHGQRARVREKDHKQLGYLLGEDIARFLNERATYGTK